MEEIGNFWYFSVFKFGPNAEIKNSESSEIFSRPLKLNEFLLFEEIGNFWGFRVFDFGLYSEIENSENLEIFSRLLNLIKYLLLEEIWRFPRILTFWVSPLYSNRKSGKKGIFFTACNCLFGLPRFPSFRFYPLYWNWKLTTLRNFFKISKFERISFIWGNFQGFRVFEFGFSTVIENPENSDISSRLVFVLLEEIGNFQGFRVFEFGSSAEIKNIKNSDLISRSLILNELFCLRKLGISEVSEFSSLVFLLKLKNRKTRKYFKGL